MYRLLVVDDEPFIVNGLYDFLLHMADMELDVYKAYSGDEAIEWLRRAKIDIVITDIRMPGMTGIELSETIKRQWPHCRVIFLTGYDEFDYVYKAIQHDTVGYLLKTEGYEKIAELVGKAIRDIEAMLTAEDLLVRAQRQMKLAAPALQKELLLGLLRGERNHPGARRESFRQLDIPLDPEEPPAIVLGRVAPNGAGDGAPAPVRSESLFRVKLLAEQHMPPKLNAMFLAMDDQTLVWIMQSVRPAAPHAAEAHADEPRMDGVEEAVPSRAGAMSQIQGLLELVQEGCADSGLSASFVVSKPDSWEAAPDRFAALQSWLGGMPDIGGNGVILEYSPEREAPPFLQTNGDYGALFARFKQFERLGRLLESERKDDCLELLAEMTGAADRIAVRQPYAALGFYHALGLLLLSAIQGWGLSGQLGAEAELLPLSSAERLAALPDKGGYFLKLTELMFGRRSVVREDRAASAVQFIRRYIDDHLNEDLSLVRLAEVAHFNPSYLSRLFKQETGSNLNAYIQDMRLHKAAALLMDSTLKVHEIAAMIGYEYAPYFTKIFKKTFQFGPQEYRERYGNK